MLSSPSKTIHRRGGSKWTQHARTSMSLGTYAHFSPNMQYQAATITRRNITNRVASAGVANLQAKKPEKRRKLADAVIEFTVPIVERPRAEIAREKRKGLRRFYGFAGGCYDPRSTMTVF